MQVVRSLLIILIATCPTLVVAKNGEITVSGDSVIYLEPDHFVVTFHTNERDETAQGANLKLGQVTARILAILESNNIALEDVKTGGANVSEDSNIRDCGPKLMRAWQRITVTVREAAQLDNLVDEVIEAGGFIHGSIQPGLDDATEHRKAALQAAIANAKNQAEEVATQLGRSLGEATNVEFRAVPLQSKVASKEIRSGSFTGSGSRFISGLIPVSQTVKLTFSAK